MDFRIRKKQFVVIPLLAVLVAGAVTWFVRSDAPRRAAIRNVVLISIDTCRADHLSCYGYPLQTTPNIDAIAQDGVMFTHAQSTNSITLPAHCSMLTGTNPIFHGVHLNQNHALDDSNVTLAEIMRGHGYQTGAVVGAFPLHSTFGLDQGFDTYDEQFSRKAGTHFYNERDAQEVSRAAISWLEQHHDEPLFLFVHYFDPHSPYAPPEPFASAFSAEPYGGEIAYTDFCIGQIIDNLKKLRLFDSTLIIITADHGEGLGEHDEQTHAYWIYQSTVRVPLIIKGPGFAAGRKVDDAVGLIDIVPTVLRLLGLSVPPQVQGVDLSGYLGDRIEPVEDRFLYSESLYPVKFDCCPLRGLVHGKWRYIWSVRPELYDLKRDRGETNNLVDEEKQKAELLQRRLKEMLADQRRRAGKRRSFVPDQETVQRLQSLGYVGGPVVDAALEIDMHMEDPKDFIGIFNKFLLAKMYFDQKRLDEARAECLDILARRRKLLPVMLLLGPIAYNQGRMADAVTRFSEVFAAAADAKDPQAFAYDVYVAHNSRGNAYLGLGNYELALKDYAHAIQFRPDDAEPYNNRGNAHTHLGNYQPALNDYNKAIGLKPEFAEAYYNRANVYKHFGNYQHALDDYNEAIGLKPESAEAYYNRANVYKHFGNYQHALDDYNKAIGLKPESAEAYNNRASIYKHLCNYQHAIDDCNRAIGLMPEFAEAYNNRGAAYEVLGKYQLALDDFAEAIELTPDLGEAYNNLAWVLATCRDANYRDGERAVTNAKRACEILGRDDCGLLDTLAAAYAEAGQFGEAARWQIKAVELAPPADKSELEARLDLYKARKPYRQE